jgi:hypothetical protein
MNIYFSLGEIMEEYYKELWGKTEIENNNLKGLLLEQTGEMATLRNELRSLREQLEGKPITDKEKRLIRLAKEIIQEFDR